MPFGIYAVLQGVGKVYFLREVHSCQLCGQKYQLSWRWGGLCSLTIERMHIEGDSNLRIAERSQRIARFLINGQISVKVHPFMRPPLVITWSSALCASYRSGTCAMSCIRRMKKCRQNPAGRCDRVHLTEKKRLEKIPKAVK